MVCSPANIPSEFASRAYSPASQIRGRAPGADPAGVSIVESPVKRPERLYSPFVL